MIELIRTNSENKDFQQLVKELDAYLANCDGEEHAFYHQFNGIEFLTKVIVAYYDKQPIACGAIKELKPDTAEVKRMYTHPHYRQTGIGAKVLSALES